MFVITDLAALLLFYFFFYAFINLLSVNKFFFFFSPPMHAFTPPVLYCNLEVVIQKFVCCKSVHYRVQKSPVCVRHLICVKLTKKIPIVFSFFLSYTAPFLISSYVTCMLVKDIIKKFFKAPEVGHIRNYNIIIPCQNVSIAGFWLLF